MWYKADTSKTKSLALTILFIILSFNISVLSQELHWNSLNGPMGGVVGDIAINSNGDIFAGMYPLLRNGLYKSKDNGSSWEKINTQFNDFAVFTIYIDKEDHIWVGTQEQNRIYLSVDEGQTWQIKNNGYPTFECWTIGESKEGTMFAGDADAGYLCRSTDGGNNWEIVDNIGPLAIAADSNNTIYCGTFNGLYLSTDDGITWIYNNSLGSYTVPTIIIDTNNNIYCGTGYYSNGNGLFYSANGGGSWTQSGLAGKVVLSLVFDSEGNLYAGTLNDGLYKTSDAGRNWIQYQNGLYRKDVYRLKINQQDDIFVGSEGNGQTGYGDGGVFRSTNGGDQFDQVGLPVSLVRNIVFSGDSVIIAATPSGIQKYNRLMHTWENAGLYKVEAVTITPSNIIYAATQDEGLYKSTDLGKSWTLTNLTADTLMPVYNVLALNDDTLFASTFYNLRKSTDGGNSWEILPIITGDNARGLFFNNNILWVTGYVNHDRVLFKTSNHGLSFDSVYSGFRTWDMNCPVSALNNGNVFLASRATELNGVIRSTDLGNTWEQVLFLDNPKSIVFANNDGIVITGTIIQSYNDTNKVYISTNFGNDWSFYVQPTGFGVDIMDIKQDRSGKYFLGTSGEGLYEVDIVTEIADEPDYKYNFSLSQNYPNPFNNSTVVQYEISVSGLVTIKIYDVLGGEIKTLVNDIIKTGKYSIKFNADNLPSGVYFYRLKSRSYVQTRKMILLK